MTPSAIPGYLTKKEVEEQYGRSYRSLTRDFSTAVRLKDESILVHLKLQTEDGTVRPGTDVTLEQIQEWSNRGYSPTWFVEENWAAEKYGKRSQPIKKEPDTKASETLKGPSPHSERPTGTNELVSRLEQQIEDLQRDKEKLYQELSIKNEQIQQANERTRESNVLMKELQTLLGNVQERALLAGSTRPSTDGVADGEVVMQATNAEAKETSKSKSAQARSSKGTRRKNSSVTASKITSPSSKPKWYETPTLYKILRRRS